MCMMAEFFELLVRFTVFLYAAKLNEGTCTKHNSVFLSEELLLHRFIQIMGLTDVNVI